MEITPFKPFLTSLEKELPFYMTTIGSEILRTYVYRPYGIEDYQILYIEEGEGEAFINGSCYTLRANTILFLPPRSEHNYHPTTNSWKSKFITFNGGGTSFLSTIPAFVQTNTSDFDFSKWFKILYKYKYTPNHENSLSVTLYASLLDFKKTSFLSSSGSEEKKNRLMASVHQMSFDYNLSLADVAKTLNMSEEHFCRTFKTYTGLRPIEYLNFLKIQRAKELLRNTQRSISKIAELSGFSSPSYFTLLFKRYTGTTPKKYRES